MKRAFLAYRATGEDPTELKNTLQMLVDVFMDVGIEMYCTHLQKEENPKTEKMRAAFRKIDESDMLVVFLQSADKGEGMLLEIGYAYGKKPIYMLVKDGVEMSSLELADNVLTWQTKDHLTSQIEEYIK